MTVRVQTSAEAENLILH